MRIGVVADTHDNMPRIRQAVAVFDSSDVQQVFHAGDHVAPFSVVLWKALKMPYEGVYGNNDGDRFALATKSDGKIASEILVRKLEGRRILVIHDREMAESLVKGGEHFDIIIYGHTHEPAVELVDGTLWMNPGECGGWITGRSTVGIVDTVELSAEIIELGETEH